MKNLLVATGLTALLCGCASEPDTFYTLMPAASHPRSPSTTEVNRVIAVGPVTIPSGIDQAQLVINKGNHQLDIRESERWGSPLKDELNAALVARLGNVLANSTVVAYRQSAGVDAQIRILVDIARFELGPGNQASLDAVWTIKEGEESLEKRGRTVVSIPSDGATYEQLAHAQGKALDILAKAITDQLRAGQ